MYLITKNTPLLRLLVNNEISRSLYRTLLAFNVSGLSEAFPLIETQLLSQKHREELKRIKEIIDRNTSLYNLSTNINTLVSDNLFSLRTYNSLKRARLFTIKDILEYTGGKNNLSKLLNIKSLGKSTLVEIEDILDIIDENIVQDNTTELPAVSAYTSELMNEFIQQYNNIIKDDIYKSAIEHYYNTYKHSISVRAIHVLENSFNSILDVLCLYFKEFEMPLLNCGKKTSLELIQFINGFYNYVSSLINNQNNRKFIELSLIKDTFHFLQDEEVEFVLDYKKQHSHLPMFYLLYHFITRDRSRFASLVCRFYGIGREQEELNDISTQLGLSRERCRQLILTNKLKDCPLITFEDWDNYDFLDSILVYNTFNYSEILETERLGNLSISAFVGLCSLIKQTDYCKIKRNSSKRYYISELLYSCFDLKNCIRDIENTLNKRCTQDIALPLSTFIDSYWIKEPTFSVSKVEDAIIYIIKNDYGICIGEDRILHIMHNAIDRKGEIYKIIEENGSPMHISQIMNALKLRNDELSTSTTEQVKADIQRHPEIVPLGKSSSYAIKEWNLYTGTIRDLLYDILSNESTPISIEELYNKVSQIYPNTSIKSISSTMASDEQERFVRFEDLYYGIVGKIYPEEYIVWDIEEHSKKTFEERLREFESFLKSHRHLPRSGSEIMEEASLWRWYKRVIGNDIFISEEQRKKFSKMLNKNNDCVVTGIEYSFYRYCEEFKAYIEDNMEFPTQATDPAKYTWFMNNRKTYKNYDDKRKKYFEELIEYLYTYGYEA